MTKSVTPFLMFEGEAEKAMELYVSLFSDSEIVSIERHDTKDNDEKGPIKLAEVKICGQLVKFIDSPISHDFSFTPAFSFFVECETEDELMSAFNTLSRGGSILMPLGDYGFSKQFCWLQDRYGVSWQLNLA